jgi:phosphotransferase system enzyme I (PtsI)
MRTRGGRVLKLEGIAGGGGIGVGRAHLLDRRRLKVLHRQLAENEVDREVQRFLNAVEMTVQQLDRIRAKLEQMEEGSLILEAHQLIVADPNLRQRTIAHIRRERTNAEWALRETTRDIRRAFDRVDDVYFASDAVILILVYGTCWSL